MPTLEELIVNANEPIAAPQNAQQRAIVGERGVWLNENDEHQFASSVGDVKLNDYVINNDPNPQYKVKVMSKPIRYIRNVLVRRLKPSKPPQHGDLIIQQEPDVIKPAAPPVIIRQAGKETIKPETLVIRERPPKLPEVLPEQTIRIKGKIIEPPPRRVIVEKLPDQPAMPQDIIIEKWLPYEIQKRNVVFRKSEQSLHAQGPVKNLIIQWNHADPLIENDIKYETVEADPSFYLNKYGGALKDAIDVHEYDKNLNAYASHYRHDQLYDLEGDVFSINKLDNLTLEQLGLAVYKKEDERNALSPGDIVVDNYLNSRKSSNASTSVSKAPSNTTTWQKVIPKPTIPDTSKSQTSTPLTPSASSASSVSSSSKVGVTGMSGVTAFIVTDVTSVLVEEPAIVQTPTLKAASNFNPTSDCERLHKAMKGLGTDEKTIIEILGSRSNEQRQILKSTFQSVIDRDLIQDLNSELSGDFGETIDCLMMTPTELGAYSFMKAIKGLGANDPVLVELSTTFTSEELTRVKQTFQKMFNKTLEKEIKADTKGTFQTYVLALLNTQRPNSKTVDKSQAKTDAQFLLNAGAKKWSNDEKTFVTVFCAKSYSQIRAILAEYKTLAGRSIEDDIKKELSGDLLKLFSTLVASIAEKQLYFATVLFKSMKGIGTIDADLIRVVVSRCEIDMVEIKHKFSAAYKSTLADFIKDDTSGDYRTILFKLIDENLK